MAKASDNAFPSVLLVEQASAPATPSSGQARLYRGTDNKMYVVDDAGVATEIGAGGGGAGGTWTAWTPTLTAVTTNPTLGSGATATGRYIELDTGLIIARFTIQFGSSGVGAGSGEYRLSLPVNAETAQMTAAAPMGFASGFSPTGIFSALRVSTSTVRFWNGAGSYLGSGSGWAAGSQIWGELTYEAA